MHKEDSQFILKRFDDVNKSKTFTHILKELDLGNKSVLDIGCSHGEFLARFGTGSVGLTISPEEVDYGKGKGLDIRVGNIESSDVPVSETFDVIFANNILEHLYSPHGFLVDIKKYLKEDGVLILGVPIIPKVTSLLRLKKFRGSLAVSHINFFTTKTLEKTIERGGWNILQSRSFRFFIRIFDRILYSITPHIYVVATLNKDFKYHEKRLKELEGYK